MPTRASWNGTSSSRPIDVHDWYATAVPVLIEGRVNGQKRKLVVMANRNTFYYVLDRETGEFLVGRPYAKQTWAKGLDKHGRPIRIPNTAPTVEGRVVYPDLFGAANWLSPSYNPSNNLFYVAVREQGESTSRVRWTTSPVSALTAAAHTAFRAMTATVRSGL